jgi:hypothetical protein
LYCGNAALATWPMQPGGPGMQIGIDVREIGAVPMRLQKALVLAMFWRSAWALVWSYYFFVDRGYYMWYI